VDRDGFSENVVMDGVGVGPCPGPVELLVCTTCRSAGVDLPLSSAAGETLRAGARLLALLSAADLPQTVRLVPVECLSNCTRGCTVALRGPGRWTYVYGNLDPALHMDTLIDGTARFAAAPDGLVPWRERPDHLRKNCIARIPPLEASHV
jgi:predicted metal-binding protein